MAERVNYYQRAQDAYFDYYSRVSTLIKPGEVIHPFFHVSVMDFRDRVDSRALLFREVDTRPVGGVIWPGKSAHIAFTKDIDTACRVVFRRPAREEDRLYTVSVDELLAIEYHPYSAPLPDAPLHVRIVHKAHIDDPERPDVPRRARVKLAKLLNKNSTMW